MTFLRHHVLWIGLIGCALSAISVLAPVLGVIGAVVAAIALVVEHRSVGAFVQRFTAADWQPTGNENEGEIVVPRSRHRRRSPVGSVWEKSVSGGYDNVECFLQFIDGDLHVYIGNIDHAFDGEVRIS